MNKKLILILMTLVLASLACTLPFSKKTATPEVPATPDTSMQLYYGTGMRIMLPPSYVAEDVKEELPNIIETITNLIGSSEGFAGDLVHNLEDNIAWYGYDSGSPAVYPTRLIVIRNKTLAGLPISAIAIALEKVMEGDSTQVDQDSLSLGGRDVTRFTYSKEDKAWTAYLFKAEDQLWLSVFVTTPASMAINLSDFDTSIASISVDPLPAE